MMPAPIKIKIKGKSYKSISDACRDFNIASYVIRNRMSKYGLSAQEALEMGYVPRFKPISIGANTFPCRADAARAYGISVRTVESRMRAGWEEEEAITTPLIRKDSKEALASLERLLRKRKPISKDDIREVIGLLK
jgi:hypothetical protein